MGDPPCPVMQLPNLVLRTSVELSRNTTASDFLLPPATLLCFLWLVWITGFEINWFYFAWQAAACCALRGFQGR
jgi:hypothetical protein